MLFFLTGNIQIGKTRWLLTLINGLEQAGVTSCGVIAPGVWIPKGDSFEKLGIDNLLLPERTTIPFARRRDLAQAEGTYDRESQSAQAGLHWSIQDDAIDRVNAHLGLLEQAFSTGCTGGTERRLLVIDELGRLELLRAEGLTNAVALLDSGASSTFPDAIVVVRKQLLEIAMERFRDAPWGGIRCIAPDDVSARLVHEHLGLVDGSLD